jgi:hypothetical protein
MQTLAQFVWLINSQMTRPWMERGIFFDVFSQQAQDMNGIHLLPPH